MLKFGFGPSHCSNVLTPAHDPLYMWQNKGVMLGSGRVKWITGQNGSFLNKSIRLQVEFTSIFQTNFFFPITKANQ